MHALIILAVLPGVVRARQLRSLLGTQLTSVGKCTPGRATYDLRRLRLHGLIERHTRQACLPCHYRSGDARSIVLRPFLHDALIGPGMADLMPSIAAAPTPVRQAMEKLRMTMDAHIDHALKAVA